MNGDGEILEGAIRDGGGRGGGTCGREVEVEGGIWGREIGGGWRDTCGKERRKGTRGRNVGRREGRRWEEGDMDRDGGIYGREVNGEAELCGGDGKGVYMGRGPLGRGRLGEVGK